MRISVFISLLISLLLTSCSSKFGHSVNLKVMPIGDSRVQGARPNYESYRYELWKNLTANKWNVDFIGPFSDDAVYPSYMNKEFDSDHSGVAGYTSQDILKNIDHYVSTSGKPDLALLGIGINDILQGVPVSDVVSNVEKIINHLQSENESIIIFLERVTPGHSRAMSPYLIDELQELNARIVGIVERQTTIPSRIIAVDIESDWNDSYMADALHFNKVGAKEIADRYYLAIEKHVPH